MNRCRLYLWISEVVYQVDEGFESNHYDRNVVESVEPGCCMKNFIYGMSYNLMNCLVFVGKVMSNHLPEDIVDLLG